METKSKLNKNTDGVWMGFDIKTDKGPILLPVEIEFWNKEQYNRTEPESPFYYKADALLGLSLTLIQEEHQQIFPTKNADHKHLDDQWKNLEPHFELYQRSQERVNALRSQFESQTAPKVFKFEKVFGDLLSSSIDETGFDFKTTGRMLETIEDLETQMGKPLVYNFNLVFSPEFSDRMHKFYSFLFNLRTLIAMDYNAHIKDTTHDGIKVDSITDYLHKGDYVVNDALLYWEMKKMKPELGSPLFWKIEKGFQHFLHNGYQLINSLPRPFLEALPEDASEDALYLAQMDWLLGTDAGLMFRIREEVYGLAYGYDKVFWPELDTKPNLESHTLSVQCLLPKGNHKPTQKAA